MAEPVVLRGRAGSGRGMVGADASNGSNGSNGSVAVPSAASPRRAGTGSGTGSGTGDGTRRGRIGPRCRAARVAGGGLNVTCRGSPTSACVPATACAVALAVCRAVEVSLSRGPMSVLPPCRARRISSSGPGRERGPSPRRGHGRAPAPAPAGVCRVPPSQRTRQTATSDGPLSPLPPDLWTTSAPPPTCGYCPRLVDAALHLWIDTPRFSALPQSPGKRPSPADQHDDQHHFRGPRDRRYLL
ncbi:hypothetical protein SAMN05421505_109180 [Sinosporangium album]|uniref:Uncharacterized protein n=1 Tax=Sinosporangium album TaxID=504805 RepID=A0A1G7YBM0_9ACTN|nr:hypothetical protein SAMN05421505_109180 [Sinosporangium album]